MKTLVVEENATDARLIVEMLNEAPDQAPEVREARRLDSALQQLKQESFDIVVLDLGLPDSEGVQALSHLREIDANVPIVVVTDQSDRAFAVETTRSGASDCLVKGRFDGEALNRALRYAVEGGKARQAVRAERQRIFDVLESMPAMVCLLTADYQVPFANRAFRERFGDARGRACYEYRFGRTEPCEFCQSAAVFETGEPHHWEVNGPDGCILDVHAVPFVDTDGAPMVLEMDIDITERRPTEAGLRVLGASVDITERKCAETSLRVAHERLRRFVDSNIVGVLIADAGGNVIEANDYYLRMIGFTRDEFQRGEVNWRAITPPEWLPADEQALHELAERGSCTPYEKEYLRRDGTRVPVYLADTMLPGPGRQIAAFALDLTERKRAEDEVRKLNAELERRVADRTKELNRRMTELETIFQTVPVGLAIADDPEGRHIRGNPTIERLIGVEAGGELSLSAGQPPAYKARAGDGTEVPASELPMQRSCRGEVVTGWLMKIERPNGEVSILHSNATPLRDESGQLRGAVGAFLDITGLTHAEQQIRTLNTELQRRAAELEASNEELEAFAYSVSHDLRAPLRAIDGFSQVLLEEHREQLNDEGRRNLERVWEASQRMGRLVDDLLGLSRLTRSEMRRGPVDLSATAVRIAAELRASDPARAADIRIQPGLMAEGDAGLLRVVLENLLNNAWKFTARQPAPVIEFGATEREGERAFFVRDNGAGFDMAFAGRLFGAFQRLHSATEFPGTGVGLATVQRIIHRHGGRIAAESAVGQGATFYFTLQPKADPIVS